VDPSLAILTITPLTLTLPFALTSYLFVAHTLRAPDYASGAALLAGGVTALVGKFCVGLVEDTADTLYLCYCIDRDVGRMHRQEVFDAFEWQGKRSPVSLPSQRPQPAASAPFPTSSVSSPLSDDGRSPSPEQTMLPSAVRSPIRSPPTKAVELQEEDDDDEESMMLGLDFF